MSAKKKFKMHTVSDSSNSSSDEDENGSPDERFVPSTVFLRREELEVDDNEVLLLKAPADMDIQRLHGCLLSLKGEGSLQCGQTAYRTSVDENRTTVQVLLMDRKDKLQLVKCDIFGSVDVTEHIPAPAARPLGILEKAPVTVPECSSRRHPLYGKDATELMVELSCNSHPAYTDLREKAADSPESPPKRKRGKQPSDASATQPKKAKKSRS